jgi:hypothetical protein
MAMTASQLDRLQRVPDELKALPNWLCWRFNHNVPVGQKPPKVSVYANGNTRGSWGTEDDRAALVSFDEAVAAAQARGFDGLNFAFFEDTPYIGLDFDADRETAPESVVALDGDFPVVRPEIDAAVFGTYSELSPSGRGLRAIVRRDDSMVYMGAGQDSGKDGWGLEVRVAKGTLSMTGNVTPSCEAAGFDNTISAPSEELKALYRERFANALAKAQARALRSDVDHHGDALGLSVEDLKRLAEAADTSGYHNWVAVGMALHHELEGSAEGFEIFASVSDDEREARDKWNSFGRGGASSNPVTARALIKMAKDEAQDNDDEDLLEFISQIARDALALKPEDFPYLGEAPKAAAQAMVALSNMAAADTASAVVEASAAAGALAVADGKTFPDGLERCEKTGMVLASLNNVTAALVDGRMVGARLMFDSFHDELLLCRDGKNWTPITDATATDLRMRLEGHADATFKSVSRELMRDALGWVSETCRQDRAQSWITGLEWDGVDRVSNFLATYFGTADTPYTRAVSRYIWTGMAARVMEPGCKLDMMPIFNGEQGAGKSTGVQAMSPWAAAFGEINLAADDKDLARALRGKLVLEVAELNGLHTKAVEGIKAFITRTVEQWTPKFKEYDTAFARRCMLFGTTNADRYLADDTGERRFLPVTVLTKTDPGAIERDRDQLWAQGLAMWRESGVAWKDAMTLATDVHTEFKMVDPWEERVQAWLDEPEMHDYNDQTPRGEKDFTLSDVLEFALSLPTATHKRETPRVSALLKRMGYTTRRVGAKKRTVWVRA